MLPFAFRTTTRAKRIAKRLRSSLATEGMEISLAASQAMTAHLFGYADWHALNAKTSSNEGPFDDELPPPALSERHAAQVTSLISDGVRDALARRIVENLHPTSRGRGDSPTMPVRCLFRQDKNDPGNERTVDLTGLLYEKLVHGYRSDSVSPYEIAKFLSSGRGPFGFPYPTSLDWSEAVERFHAQYGEKDDIRSWLRHCYALRIRLATILEARRYLDHAQLTPIADHAGCFWSPFGNFEHDGYFMGTSDIMPDDPRSDTSLPPFVFGTTTIHWTGLSRDALNQCLEEALENVAPDIADDDPQLPSSRMTDSAQQARQLVQSAIHELISCELDDHHEDAIDSVVDDEEPAAIVTEWITTPKIPLMIPDDIWERFEAWNRRQTLVSYMSNQRVVHPLVPGMDIGKLRNWCDIAQQSTQAELARLRPGPLLRDESSRDSRTDIPKSRF